MDKIRLCFILSHLPQGGAERQTINLIRGLNPDNYEITLILYANSEIFYKEVVGLPIKLIINSASRSNKLVRNIKHAIFLRKALKINEFDVLHTMLYHNGLWVRILAPRKYYGRILYSVRNTIDEIPFYERLAEKLLAGRSQVVTNSKKVLEQYVSTVGEHHRPRVVNVYNGIEVSKFSSEQPPVVGEEIILGSVGRQTILKNQIQILQAIRSIAGTVPVHFYLIGDKTKESYIDNERFVIENRLGENVTILDSQAEIELYYKRFNVFVLSSINESCPNALLEAMLSRCLCVVSEGANSDHFITDGVNGLIYNGTDKMLADKLLEAITLIRNNKHHIMVDNGFDYVIKNFSYNSMVLAYNSIYQKILASASSNA